MSTHTLDSQLSQFETQLAFLSAAVVQGEPAEWIAALADLQSMAVSFSETLPQMSNSLKHSVAGRMRVKAIAARLVALREGMLRQNVGVERALAALMPAARAHTYSPQSGVSKHQPYASVGRQSGEFRATTA